jgi:hypothetical protein
LPSKVAKSPEGEQLGNLGNLAKSAEKMTIFAPQEPKVAKLAELGNLAPSRVRVTI